MGAKFSANKPAKEPVLAFLPQKKDNQDGNQLPRNYGQVFGDSRYWHLVPEEIGRGPYELSLYLAILKEGSIVDRSVRVHVVGNFAQGKTSLVQRLIRDDVKKVQSTDGIKVTRLKSCGRHLQKYQDNNPKSENYTKAFTEEMMFQDEEVPIKYDIWDFGGQYVFYATHSLFHSNRAIYLLVMNLSKDMDKIIKDKKCPNETGNRNMEYFIRFWMSSIHSFAGTLDGHDPPVILVGTHMDRVKGFRKRTKLKHAVNYFENVRQLFDGTQVINHIQKKDFAVNNARLHDENIDMLREEILRIGQDKASAVDIPTRWIELDDKMKLFTENVITLDDIKATITEKGLPLMNEEEIKLFLQHAKGTLFYLDRKPVADYVVLDPQYLIDAFKCIVTSERFCRKDPEIRPLWIKLTTEGRLEMKLVDSLWNTKHGFINHKDVLLGYLKQHHIISEALQYDDNMEKAVGLGWYIVPSLLKDHCSQSVIEEYLSGKVQVQVRFVMCFEFSSVVTLLFQRLIAATLGKWPIATFRGENLMYINLTAFRLNVDHDGIMEIKDNLIELSALNLCPSGCIDGCIVDSFRRFAENVVLCEIAALKGSKEEKGIYVSYFRCNNSCHGMNGSKEIQEISYLSTKSKSSIPCPDRMPHEIDTCRAKSEWFQEDVISQTIPKKHISDREFSRIAQAIGFNWRFLGLELGLTDVQIDQIVEDNPHSVAMQIYKMLIKWRLSALDEATMDNFVTVLKQCGNVNIDWDAIRNIIDEMNIEQEHACVDT